MIFRRILLLLHSRTCGLASRLRNVYYRTLGVRIRGYIWMRAVEIPRNPENIELDTCSLDRGVVLLVSGEASTEVKISIGSGTYINRRTFIDACASIHIGKHVAIGPDCYITDHDHGHDPARSPLDQPMIVRPTQIGDHVWIGAHAIILKGVTVGDRTIIAAGSVVTKSLPADVIAAGVPARVLRSRSTDSSPAGETNETGR